MTTAQRPRTGAAQVRSGPRRRGLARVEGGSLRRDHRDEDDVRQPQRCDDPRHDLHALPGSRRLTPLARSNHAGRFLRGSTRRRHLYRRPLGRAARSVSNWRGAQLIERVAHARERKSPSRRTRTTVISGPLRYRLVGHSEERWPGGSESTDGCRPARAYRRSLLRIEREVDVGEQQRAPRRLTFAGVTDRVARPHRERTGGGPRWRRITDRA